FRLRYSRQPAPFPEHCFRRHFRRADFRRRASAWLKPPPSKPVEQEKRRPRSYYFYGAARGGAGRAIRNPPKREPHRLKTVRNLRLWCAAASRLFWVELKRDAGAAFGDWNRNFFS